MMLPSSATLMALAMLAQPMPDEMVDPMTDTPHVLNLDVQHDGGVVDVRLTGNAAQTQDVSYVIEVTGQSTSRHRGKTTLTGGTPAVLSTLRVSVGTDWCVKLIAEEAGREPYEISHGPCAGR